MSGAQAISHHAATILATISGVLTLQRNRLWAPAALAAILLIRHAIRARKAPESLVITNLSKVARRVKTSTDSDEYDEDEYDVIIVGGGTAGCVLAARLSEDPTIRVLLLEAGQSLADSPNTKVPVASGAMFHTIHGWDLWTESQDAAGSRKLFWPRAKLLGGCTNINAMIFQSGHPTDYDEWAALQRGQPGASEWTYNQFNKYFRKFEQYNPSQQVAQIDSTLKGTTGPVTLGHYGYRSVIGSGFVAACDSIGIKHMPDLNTAAGTLGATQSITYIDSKGNRVTAERAYLTPTVLARSNLKVATQAHVTRILFEDGVAPPRAVGVEFADPSRNLFRARARKEVIVSGGAVHTPHILMLSGIGPAKHLQTHNIPVVANIPGVGQHLKDHATLDLHFMDKTKTSLMFLRPRTLWRTIRMHMNTMQYLVFGTGGLTTNVGEATAFAHTSDPRLFPPSKYPQQSAPEDLASGKGAPDIEIFASPLTYIEHGAKLFPLDGDFFALHAVGLRPKSSGTITLKSSDPFDKPVIDPRYLSEKHDVDVMVRAVRLAGRIARQEPLRSMVDPDGDNEDLLSHNIDKMSDEEIAVDVAKRMETLYHPCCTARMAPLEDGGVVDPYLRVHGVQNLRVIDASVFPEIVSGHTTAPVLAIAEKAADFIKEVLRK